MLQGLRTLQRLLPLLGLWGLALLSVQKLAGRKIVRLRVRNVPVPLFARFNNSDLSVLYQVFGLQECAVDLAHDPKTIVDGGANVGYSSVYFALRYPQATILAVEPCDENAKLLRRNCKSFPTVTLLRGAIWHSHAPLEILNPHERGWMIQVQETSGQDQGTLSVFTIDDLIATARDRWLDILKLDIEGAEKELFCRGELRWINRVGCLIIEAHGESARAAVCEVMRQRGFQCEALGEKLVFQRISTQVSTLRSQ